MNEAKKLRKVVPSTMNDPNAFENLKNIKGVQFTIKSPDEIRKEGVVSITNPRYYEKQKPAINGLFDLRMGPTNREFLCETCGEGMLDCPGHSGYIDLAFPVYHPLFMTEICKILNCVCHKCSSLLVIKTEDFLRRMRQMKHGKMRIKYIFELMKKKKMRTCGVCQAESKSFLDSVTPAVVEPSEKKKRNDKPEKKVRFSVPVTVSGGGSLWGSSPVSSFVEKIHPAIEEIQPQKNLDLLIKDEGCLSIQPKVVQEGSKIVAVWPDAATLYGFLTSNDFDNDEDDEVDEVNTNMLDTPIAKKKPSRKNRNDDDDDDDDDDGNHEMTAKEETPKDQKEKKKKLKKASDATDNDVLLLLKKSPYTFPAEAKPGNREAITPTRAREILRYITDEDAWLLGYHPEYSHPSWMVLTVLEVPPPNVRLPIKMPNGGKRVMVQDHLTLKLLDIVKKNLILQKQLKFNNRECHDQFGTLLQWHVATYMDNTDRSRPQAKLESGKPIGSVMERMKGKQGRFRQNLMGKRVDFTSRDVISPDANLRMDELGVPSYIMETLTYPERVTPYNFKRLQQAVVNGPHHPEGALYVIDDQNRFFDLTVKKDIVLQMGWKVERMMRDGDKVLFNRQPSLHKMSMMGHRVKRMAGSTFRLNVNVTEPYNADFDGDEMNMHLMQSEGANAELDELMMVNHQMITPQKNAPVMGLKQDSLLTVRLFTHRDTFLPMDVAMQVMASLVTRTDDLPQVIKNFGQTNSFLPIPAILKAPLAKSPIWTGKQFISEILPPELQLTTWSQFSNEKTEQMMMDPSDTRVVIEDGELLQGTLDKKTFGARQGSLVHVLVNDYSGKKAMDVMDATMIMLHEWMMSHGFSVGIADAMSSIQTQDAVQSVIKETKACVHDVCEEMKRGTLEVAYGKTMMQTFETKVNEILNKARDRGGNIASEAVVYSNGFKLMETAGSKGSKTNMAQIASLVGQQNVAGQRVPLLFNSGRRAFPHCQLDDHEDIESRGFVQHSYVDGLSPMEFFTHAMGGREGLTDTAVKTAETGYLQRRLIKSLEDCCVAYDKTVRDSLNCILQFSYGEDDMDAVGLESQKIELMTMDNATMLEKFWVPTAFVKDTQLLFSYSENATDALSEEVQDFKTLVNLRTILREYIFPNKSDECFWPLPGNVHRTIQRGMSKDAKLSVKNVLTLQKAKAMLRQFQQKIWLSGDFAILESPWAKERQVASSFLFMAHVSSMLAPKRVVVEYHFSLSTMEWVLQSLMDTFQKVRINPGESVGALAGQSIGEPATQMTLNTFHSAGISSRNVTLGLPRLEECIKATRYIKTPGMTFYLKEDCRRKDALEEADRARILANRLQYTQIKHLTLSSTIEQDPLPNCLESNDREFVERWIDTEPEPLEPISEWVIRLTFQKEIMTEREYTITQIATHLREILGTENNNCYIIPSDDNEKEGGGVIRIYVYQRVLDRHVETSLPDRETMPDPEFVDNLDPKKWINSTYRQFCANLERFILNAYVGGVPGITKVVARQVKKIVYDEKTGKPIPSKEWVLETEGSNVMGIMSVDGIDGKRVVSNHPIEMAQILGVEVARQILLNEIRAVISFYGLYVNYRHLSLLCDYMTHNGNVRAISRHTHNKRRTGALMRCTFEEPVDILRDSALYAEYDECNSVSQAVMLGKYMPHGTGMMDILADEEMMSTLEIPPVCFKGDYLGQEEVENPFEKDAYDMVVVEDDNFKKNELIAGQKRDFDSLQESKARIVDYNPFDVEHLFNDSSKAESKMVNVVTNPFDQEATDSPIVTNTFDAEPCAAKCVFKSLKVKEKGFQSLEKTIGTPLSIRTDIYIPSSPRRH